MDINSYLLVEESKSKPKQLEGLAEVIDVKPNGVKIKLAAENVVRETYYNSLQVVNIGDIVYYKTIKDTLFIEGSFKYNTAGV